MNNIEGEIQKEQISKFSWLRIFRILGISILILAFITGIYLALQTKQFRIAYASIIHNNIEHFTDCYGLPFFPQVEKAMNEHMDIVDRLKSAGAISVTAEKLVCKGWDGGIELIKGDMLIQYKDGQSKSSIVNVIGDNFFGIPYRGEKK